MYNAIQPQRQRGKREKKNLVSMIDNADKNCYVCPICGRVWNIYTQNSKKFLFYPSIAKYGKKRKPCPFKNCESITASELQFKQLFRRNFELRKEYKGGKNG